MDILSVKGRLQEEIEEGNVEYKRHLDHLKSSDFKFRKLASQMIWRIDQNRKKGFTPEAKYYIGIEDNGDISGMDKERICKSIKVLKMIAKETGRNIEIVSEDIRTFKNGVVAEIIVRLLNDITKEDMRVCLLGDTNAGKSTLISMLCYNVADDGNGSARSNVFKHYHEFENGTTSSIRHDIIGFKNDKLINYKTSFVGSWDIIATKSDKVIELIDLPGDKRYIKTFLHGLMSIDYDLALIVVDIQNKDNISYYVDLCNKLDINYKIIITKIDLVEDTYDNDDDIYMSNITKKGVANLIKYLKDYKIDKQPDSNNNSDIEFIINETLYIHDVGTVIIGVLKKGFISLNDQLLLGPIRNKFINVKISSIHKKRISSKCLYEGESGSLVIESESNMIINKHMALINEQMLKNFNTYFFVKFKEGKDINNLQLLVHISNLYEKVLFLNIKDNTVFKGIFSDGNPKYISRENKVLIRYDSDLIIGDLIESLDDI